MQKTGMRFLWTGRWALRFLFGFSVVTVLFTPVVFSVTIQVPSQAPTIQAGIDSVSPGDTVLVAPGTYVGVGNREISFGGKDIVVRSEFGADSTSINLGNAFRGFSFTNGETRTAVLRGFTIIHGRHPVGGAIHCQNSSPSILDCDFTSNAAGTFEPNGVGGAIAFSGSACSSLVQSCDFTGNLAMLGGAILVADSAYVDIRSCGFYDNVNINGAGGALAVSNYGRAQLFNSEFLRNYSPSGGAVWISDSGRVSGSIVLLARNESTTGGSAIHISNANGGNLSNVTIVLNESPPLSGAISCGSSSSFSLQKAIIAFEQGGSAVRLTGGSISFICSDIYGNAGGDWTGVIAGQLGINNNFYANPLMCDTSSDDFAIQLVSQCTTDSSTCGALVGAIEPQCGCCLGLRGNVNDDPEGSIDISDLTYLVNYFFKSGPPAPCMAQSNVNGDSGFTISDITYLAAYMFKGGPAPPPCL